MPAGHERVDGIRGVIGVVDGHGVPGLPFAFYDQARALAHDGGAATRADAVVPHPPHWAGLMSSAIALIVILVTRFVWNPDVPGTLPTH